MPVAIVGSETSQQFVQAKHVAGNLDRSRLIKQGDGFRDLSRSRFGLDIGGLVFLPAFDKPRSDAQVQTHLQTSPHLGPLHYAEEWRRRLQPSVNRSWANSERLNDKAHVLKGRMIRLHRLD